MKIEKQRNGARSDEQGNPPLKCRLHLHPIQNRIRIRDLILRFPKHFSQVDFDTSSNCGDRDVVGRTFEGVFADNSDSLHRVEDPGDNRCERDSEPHEVRAELWKCF